MSNITGKIIEVSERGQITIPKIIREEMPMKYFVCEMIDGKLILEPLQTKEEFLAELAEDEKEWKKKGGYSFDEVMKKSHKKQ